MASTLFPQSSQVPGLEMARISRPQEGWTLNTVVSRERGGRYFLTCTSVNEVTGQVTFQGSILTSTAVASSLIEEAQG